MKKKDLKELRDKTKEELVKIVDKKKIELYKTQALVKATNEKNLKRPKNLRHDISQVLSIIKEKEIIEKLSSQVDEKTVGINNTDNNMKREEKEGRKKVKK